MRKSIPRLKNLKKKNNLSLERSMFFKLASQKRNYFLPSHRHAGQSDILPIMGKPPGIFNVAVEGIVIKDGKILITQRSYDRSHAPGEWEILTGRVDQGETFEEAVKREVKEEVGLEVEVQEPINTFHFYYGPENAEHLGVSFLCKYVSGEVTLDKNEQIGFKWASPEEAEKLIKDKSILSSIQKVKKLL